MKLLYPTSLSLDIEQLKGFGVALHAYDAKQKLQDELVDAEVLVTWSNSAENLKDAAQRMKNIRWIQSLAAGPNDVLNAGFDSSKVVITTGSGLHDHTVAEHTLGLLLIAARKFHEMRDSQLLGEWPGHLGGPQPDRPAGAFTTLEDANILIWGFGNIARKLAPWLTSLGAKVTGIARKDGVRDGVEVYAESKLPQLLPKIDALVMILPGSDSTRHALNAERLTLLPKHAWIVNVGRGSTVDEEALVKALEEQRIGGAALDVFAQEPLPESSPLYKQKNVVLSPHAAGGRPQRPETLITYNLRRLLADQPLKNVV